MSIVLFNVGISQISKKDFFSSVATYRPQSRESFAVRGLTEPREGGRKEVSNALGEERKERKGERETKRCVRERKFSLGRRLSVRKAEDK